MILIFFALIQSSNLNKPFIGHHDWVSTFYGVIARNYVRLGLTETKLGQVDSVSITNPKEFTYHTHHPLLYPLLIAGSIRLFGEHEWSIRLISFLSSIGFLLIYFVLIKRYFGHLISLLSSVFILATPMFLYFSILPDKEPFVLFIVLLIIYFYLEFSRNSGGNQPAKAARIGRNIWRGELKNFRRSHLFERQSNYGVLTASTANREKIADQENFLATKALLLFLFIIGGLTHWLFYLLPPVFFLHHFLITHKLMRTLFLLFALCSLLSLTFAFHLWHTWLLTGDLLGGGLRETLQFRLSSSSSDQTSFTTLEYISKLFMRLGNYFGWIVLPFVGIGLFFDGWRGWKGSLLFLLLSIGLLYPIVFRNYVYIHDYLLFYFLPFWGLSAALGLMTLLKTLKFRLKLGIPFPLFTFLSFFTLLTLTLIDRGTMIQALFSSDWYRLGRSIGLAIRDQTRPEDGVVIADPTLAETYSQFIKYYSDRHVTFDDLSETTLNDPKYSAVAVLSTTKIDPQTSDYLTKNFKPSQQGDIAIFKRL